MRILSIVASLDPVRGGTQSGATNMVLATQMAGAENTFTAAGNRAARARAQQLTRPLRDAGVGVRMFPTFEWPEEAPDRWGLSVPQVRWFTSAVCEYDLVHIHGVWGFSLLAGLRAAVKNDVPVVVTPHESLTAYDIEVSSGSQLRRRQKLLLKEAYIRWATYFVLTSDLEAASSLPPALMQRRSVVHYPLAEVQPVPPRDVNADGQGAFRVGFLGRLHPKKNLNHLIEALPALGPGTRLVIAGDGPLMAEMRRLTETLAVAERVEWRGFVAKDERPEFFTSVDVLAMPSEFESFGMSAAEAMLQGLPVIVSERTGVAEIIRRAGGGLVASPDRGGLLASLLELRDASPDRRHALGQQGRAAILSEMSFSATGKALCAAYEKALML